MKHFRSAIILGILVSNVFAQDSLDLPLCSTNAHIGFMPGDAFFPLAFDDFQNELYSDVLAETPRDNMQCLYAYSPVPDDAVRKTYRGFSCLRINGISSASMQNLERMCGLVALESKKLSYDMTNIHKSWILIYNRDVNLAHTRLFVRCNETWTSQDRSKGQYAFQGDASEAFMSAEYQSHVKASEAVAYEWMHSKEIPALDANLPTIVTYDNKRRVAERVQVSFDNIVLVALPRLNPDESFFRKYNHPFYLCDKNGLRRARWAIDALGDVTLVYETITPAIGR